MQPKYLVVDGMALLFRHFFATSFRNQFMYNSKDIPTNGVQGVVRHIYKLISITRPTHVIVAWDVGAHTIRNEWFEGYKKNRELPPEALIPQFDYVKEVLDALGMYQVGIEGYEADDVIGTLINHIDNAIVVTGDRDLLQVLKPHDKNEVWLTKKGFSEYHYYDYDTFVSEYDITPEQFIDVKALMGDPGDGYFGVSGIGEKTALKLIRQYESLEGIIANLDELTPRMQEKIETEFESLNMSLRLAAIITKVPIPVHEIIEKSVFKIDIEDAQKQLIDHELTISSRYLNSLDFGGSNG